MSPSVRARRELDHDLPVVVALIPNDDARAGIAHALRGVALVAFCALADDTEKLVLGRQAHAFLTGEADGNHRPVGRMVSRLRLQRPDLPIVLVLGDDATAADAARVLARIPAATDAVPADHALIRRRVATLITRSQHRERREAMATVLAAQVPRTASDVVRYALAHGDRPSSVRELAAAIGVPRKTMDRRLSKAVPATARQLIGWGRLIAAAMQLESTAVSVDAVAMELRFSSPSALRNLLQRYAGLTPTELRTLGGSDYLAGRLRAMLGV